MEGPAEIPLGFPVDLKSMWAVYSMPQYNKGLSDYKIVFIKIFKQN